MFGELINALLMILPSDDVVVCVGNGGVGNISDENTFQTRTGYFPFLVAWHMAAIHFVNTSATHCRIIFLYFAASFQYFAQSKGSNTLQNVPEGKKPNHVRTTEGGVVCG